MCTAGEGGDLQVAGLLSLAYTSSERMDVSGDSCRGNRKLSALSAWERPERLCELDGWVGTVQQGHRTHVALNVATFSCAFLDKSDTLSEPHLSLHNWGTYPYSWIVDKT